MAVASLDIEPPTDTVPPVITLNGSQNISLQLGSVFNDPGATAFDNFDGDITDQIQSNSNIDTSTVGTYQVVYEVNDLAGNLNTAVRTITVSENTSNSIVVDGDISDWTDIPVLTSSGVGSIKVSDSITNLYILVEGYQPLGENTQSGLKVALTIWLKIIYLVVPLKIVQIGHGNIITVQFLT